VRRCLIQSIVIRPKDRKGAIGNNGNNLISRGYSLMKLLFFTEQVHRFFLFLICLLLFATTLHGAQFEEEVSTEKYLFVKGIIRSVSLEDQTVTLKQKKGPNISFSVDKDTIFEGFYKLTELTIRQKIKVWYQPGEQGNRALKILKPVELGC
jgi:hypothetical protein